MSNVFTIIVRVLFLASILLVLAADWLLPGTGYGFLADTLGFFGVITFGLLSAILYKTGRARMLAACLVVVIVFGLVAAETQSEWFGYRLYLTRHGDQIQRLLPDLIKGNTLNTSPIVTPTDANVDSVLMSMGIHDCSTHANTAAFMIDSDDLNSHICLIFAPDSAPQHSTLYALGLRWITTEPRHLADNWYYCEEAVE